jgi:hypothetical protein
MFAEATPAGEPNVSRRSLALAGPISGMAWRRKL